MRAALLTRRVCVGLAIVVLAAFAGCTPDVEEGDDCNNGRDDDDDGLIDCIDPNCALVSVCQACGDGTLAPDEVCDDGNLLDGDGCDARCLNESCPNGVRDPGEECDDGNFTAGDGCDARCEVNRCGDRIIQTELEACEDGNITSGDGCDARCKVEPGLSTCGNGIFDFDPNTGAQLEQCEDGNRRSGDGCSAFCTFEGCGDGITEPNLGEQCDDADPNGPPACINCRIPVCGNFFFDVGEQCDDGNTVSGDGCTAQCRQEFCGDGVVQPNLGEQCDDGNFNNGDGCASFCAFE